MKQKKGIRSYGITIGGAVVVFVLVAAFLGGLRSTQEVVVAGSSLPGGARLTSSYLELREIHTSDVHPNALSSIEEAEGQVLTIARAPGDQITADMLGDQATVGIATQLEPGHRAVGVHVNQASGLVGILRPGDHVSVVAILDSQSAQMQQGTAYPAPVLNAEVRVRKRSNRSRSILPARRPTPSSPTCACSWCRSCSATRKRCPARRRADSPPSAPRRRRSRTA